MRVTSVVAQQVKLQLAMTASHSRRLVGVHAAPPSIQLPTNGPGKIVDDGPCTWAHATHAGDQHGILTSGFGLDQYCPEQLSRG